MKAISVYPEVSKPRSSLQAQIVLLRLVVCALVKYSCSATAINPDP